MNEGVDRRFTEEEVTFTAPVPVWSSLHPDAGPEAPLVVSCHGMSEGPASLPRFWPHLCSLPVHLLAPAGPLPHEVRGKDGIRIGHAWYLYDGNPEPFKTTLFRSAAWLADRVAAFEREHGLRPSRRALLGYSQGAYFSYTTALTRQDLFDTLIAVAGGRIRTDFVAEALAAPGRLGTLILHGEEDRAVAPTLAREAAETLRGAGYEAEVTFLPGGHGLRADRDETATRWLAARWGLPLPPGLA